MIGAMAMEVVGRAAIKEMILPPLQPVLVPVTAGFGMNWLLSAGAWDNAK